jgi:cell wall-associated NlpC family hydrolase
MTPEAFTESARRLVGAKWRHHGRQAHAVDCVGLIALAFAGCGMPFDDVKGYSREPMNDLLRREAIKRWGEPLPREAAQAGDIVLMRWGKAAPSHTGIVANHPDGGLSLIHASALHGVIEQRFAGLVMAAVTDVFRPWGSRVN